ncbi:MAG: VTT domain-containing protein [Candidatus Dormibacteraeota bacterium]|nr:VTT domain-containing protein [Candidatus Dormibacteraeota bacterium]MBO0760536.1 VTT domain-containing protein [Candidatus Dormibacteraeota bacterium]
MNAQAAVALASIAALLLVEEIGVPLPMFPADGLLIAAGILATTRSIPGALIVAALVLTDTCGAVIGYMWVRVAGREPLRRIAGRVGVLPAFDRLSTRLRASGAPGIFMTRLVPGTRVYTNLVSGAVGVRPRTFLIGTVPASALWVTAIVSLGMLVGQQAARYVRGFEQVSLDLVLALGLASIAYLALRVIPGRHRRRASGAGAGWAAPALALGLALDAVLVAVALGGLLAVVLGAFHLGEPDGVPDVTMLACGVALAYTAALRYGLGGTVGELTLRISYAWR